MSFDYVLDKIYSTEFEFHPFKHLHIKDLFKSDHFSEIVSAYEISLRKVDTDEELFQELISYGYSIINFPGCIADKDEYIRRHADTGNNQKYNNSLCEGFGIALRLTSPKSEIIKELVEFLNGADFQLALCEKFGIPRDDVYYDAGLHKYLDGYEISPHPDIRKKALTFMVNINPGERSELNNHHTHYLKFINEYKRIQSFWEENVNLERCWVPWSWCKTEKRQVENSSLVMFSPSNDTMHAVKADYDHLVTQRTQLYGNLWYNISQVERKPEWESFVIATAAG